MKCQVIYNLREKYEFCSGNDLHQFFLSETGEPAPAGCAEINRTRSLKFIEQCCDNMAYYSPSLVKHCERTKRVARRVIAQPYRD